MNTNRPPKLAQEQVHRDSPLKIYAENLITYLHNRHPDMSLKRIHEITREILSERCKVMKENLQERISQNLPLDEPSDDAPVWPTAQIVYDADRDHLDQHSYGNMTLVDNADLLPHLIRIKDKVITPFGTAYETADKLESFLKGMIDGKSQARKKEKKAMFLAKKNGDRTAEVFHNNAQANIKINMNSIIGAMGANFNFLSNVADFNAVTSTGRHFVMSAYAHAERFLESNFYFRTEDQVINFIVTCQKYGPSDETIESVLSQYSKDDIYRPDLKAVEQQFVGYLRRYNFEEDFPEVRKQLEVQTPARLTWMYYMSNMRLLVWGNEKYFRPWLDRFFDLSQVDTTGEVAPEELNQFDGDLSVLLATICHDIIPTNHIGNSINLSDTITQAPEIAKRLVHYGRHLQRCLNEIEPLFNLFMNHSLSVGYLHEHKFMYRSSVILSDTDSIIFTTRSWIEWYLGNSRMTSQAFGMNALVVYWLSKATSHLVYHLSKAVGALGEDAKRMNMKNEFMMPIELLTNLKKHYASILKIQEGVFYGDPRLDLKGVNLRGSNFSKETLNYTSWFIRKIFDTLYNEGSIAISYFIIAALKFERFVLDSVKANQTRFLTVQPIRNENEYNDEERSIYFNYLFWESVFADKYGSILIPTKCYMLPLTDLTDQVYRFSMEQHAPDIMRKIDAFLKRYKGKEVTRIPINPTTNTIPVELRLAADYKAVVYSNAKLLYLLLSSFGINTGSTSDKGRKVLLSDIYGWVELTDADRELITHICREGAE